MLDNLEKKRILTKLDLGFRSGYSTETQLITTMHVLLKRHDKGNPLDIIVLGFSKVFDTVPHIKLLFKLRNYGIMEKPTSG